MCKTWSYEAEIWWFLEILGYCNLFALFCYKYNSSRFDSRQLSASFTGPLIVPLSFQRIYFLFSSPLNNIQRRFMYLMYWVQQIALTLVLVYNSHIFFTFFMIFRPFHMEAHWKTVQCILEASHYWPLPFTMNDPLPPFHHPTHPLTFAWNKLFYMTTMWLNTSCDQGSSCRTKFTFFWKDLWEALLQRNHHIPQVPHLPSPSQRLSWLWYTFFTS